MLFDNGFNHVFKCDTHQATRPRGVTWHETSVSGIPGIPGRRCGVAAVDDGDTRYVSIRNTTFTANLIYHLLCDTGSDVTSLY